MQSNTAMLPSACAIPNANEFFGAARAIREGEIPILFRRRRQLIPAANDSLIDNILPDERQDISPENGAVFGGGGDAVLLVFLRDELRVQAGVHDLRARLCNKRPRAFAPPMLAVGLPQFTLPAYGLEIAISGPRVVNRPGRSARRISTSGKRVVSSRHQAISSQIAPIKVAPRVERNELGLTVISTPDPSHKVSLLRPSTRGRSAGADANAPQMKLKTFAA